MADEIHRGTVATGPDCVHISGDNGTSILFMSGGGGTEPDADSADDRVWVIESLCGCCAHGSGGRNLDSGSASVACAHHVQRAGWGAATAIRGIQGCEFLGGDMLPVVEAASDFDPSVWILLLSRCQ